MDSTYVMDVVEAWVHGLEQHVEDNPRFVNAMVMRVQAMLTRLAPTNGCFSEFPLEIVVLILGRLPFGREWIRAASVCKLFHLAMEALSQQHFQRSFGPCKSTDLTWKQSMFQARFLVQRDRKDLDWKEKALLCGIVDHAAMKKCDLSSKINPWHKWLPNLYKAGLRNVTNIFWSLASRDMFWFVKAVDVINDIIGVYYQQTALEQADRLRRVEDVMVDMACKFNPTWLVAQPKGRSHLMHIHTGLPELYTLSQIVLGKSPHKKLLPRTCKHIAGLWNTVLSKLHRVDPTFYSLVMWGHVQEDVADMLAPFLPDSFFLQPFFPDDEKTGHYVKNLPPIFLAQPYRVQGDAGILHCLFIGNDSWYVSDHWKSMLLDERYIIHDTPLCHYEIMDILCHLCDTDLLDIALRRGVNKNAVHPDRDAPLVTFFKSKRKEEREYDAKTTQFVTTLVHGGYPCLVSTPASWSRSMVLKANEDAYWGLWNFRIPRHIRKDLDDLLITHVTTLKHMVTKM